MYLKFLSKVRQLSKKKKKMIHRLRLTEDASAVQFFTMKTGERLAFEASISDLELLSPDSIFLDIKEVYEKTKEEREKNFENFFAPTIFFNAKNKSGDYFPENMIVMDPGVLHYENIELLKDVMKKDTKKVREVYTFFKEKKVEESNFK